MVLLRGIAELSKAARLRKKNRRAPNGYGREAI